SSRSRHTMFSRDWSSDVCSSDLHLHGLHDEELLTSVDALTELDQHLPQVAAQVRGHGVPVDLEPVRRVELHDGGDIPRLLLRLPVGDLPLEGHRLARPELGDAGRVLVEEPAMRGEVELLLPDLDGAARVP